MAAPSLFEFLKNINEAGGNPALLESDENRKAYNPFIINRGVAQTMNTVLFAQEMNRRSVTNPEMHYAFLFGAVKKMKRYSKWAKKEDANEDILLIQRIYRVNFERALEYAKILSPEQIQVLRESEEKGGQIKGKKS